MVNPETKTKRHGYKTIAEQMEADKRYLSKDPERQKAKNYNSAKSTAKRFVKKAKTSDLLELQKLVDAELISRNRKTSIHE